MPRHPFEPHPQRDDAVGPVHLGVGVVAGAPGELDAAFGPGFANREEKDGVKLNFADGSWILFRKSGTEPMIRIYCESPDAGRVGEMLDTAVRELDRAS